MELKKNDIKKLARLSRLYLTEQEEITIKDELNRIFDLIQNMQSIDTTMNMEGIDSYSHQYANFQLLREDIVTETNQRELYQSIAPDVKEGFYIVPKIIE